MKKILLSALCVLGFSTHSQAQLFSDLVMKAGYINVGGQSGASYDLSFSFEGSFFIGSRTTYLFNKHEIASPNTVYGQEEITNFKNFYRNLDGGFYFQYHFRNMMNTDKFNPYAEIYLSYKTIAPMVGMEYNLSNRFALYLQAGYGVSKSLSGILEDAEKQFNQGSWDDTEVKNHELFVSDYGKRLFISAGISFKLISSSGSSIKSYRTKRSQSSRTGNTKDNKYRILE